MAFVRSRRAAELLYVYVRDNLRLSHPDVAKRVMPYRASYLPEDRRAIERDLAQGRLLGVTTTNAMELGIDIGDLGRHFVDGLPGHDSERMAAGGQEWAQRQSLSKCAGRA